MINVEHDSQPLPLGWLQLQAALEQAFIGQPDLKVAVAKPSRGSLLEQTCRGVSAPRSGNEQHASATRA
jgi:hypothetical protein